MATTIQLGMDVSQQIAAAKQAAESLSQLSREAIELGNSLAQFNRKGDLVRVVLKGMTEDGKKATEIFKVIKGELKLSKTTVEENAAAAEKLARANEKAAASAKKLADQTRAAAEAARVAAINQAKAGIVQETLRAILPVASTTQQAAAIEGAINRITTSVARGNVSLTDFNRVLAALRGDPAALKGLSDSALKVFNDLQKLKGQLSSTGEEGKKAGEKITISWQGVVRLFQSQIIREAIQGLINGFKQSITTAAQFSIKIAEIQTISQKSGISTAQWADELRRLSSSFGVPEVDVAKGAYEALSNQIVEGRDTFQFLEEALKFGRATVTTTADSVSLLSSVLKSYNIDVSKTEQVSAVLFKTIDLGRVTASEMANTFGRIGVISRSVGVNLEETGAAIATLTVQGIKFADASTFLSNLLVKLLEPTEELKRAFTELGVVSGEALIQKLGGLGGLLQFLDQEGQKGTQQIEALTGNIRSLRGALGLTGPAFSLYQKNLEEITKGIDEFRKANEIVADSAGKKFITSLQQAKNFFEKEFGTPFIATVNDVLKVFGGLPNVIDKTVLALKIGVGVLITYKAALILNAGAAVTFSGALVALRTSILATGTAAITTGTALNSMLRLAGAGLIAFGAVELLKNSIGEVKNFASVGVEALVQLEERDRQYAKANETRLNAQKDAETEFSKVLTEQINLRFRGLINFSSEAVKQSAKIKDAQIKQFKDIEAQAKASGSAYSDSISRAVSKIRERLTESENLVRDSIKNVQNIPDQQSKSTFDIRSTFANDQQQIDLIGKRIDELRNRARSLFTQGTKESVEEARKLFGEIENLEISSFQKTTERRKKAFEEGLISGPSTERTDEFGRRRLEFVVSTAEVEARITSIASERIRLETAFQEQQKKAQADLVKEKEKETIRLKEIQDLIKRAAEFDVFGAEGKVASRFTPLGERTDPAKAAAIAGAEFEKIVNEIRSKATIDEQKNFQFFSDLQRQKIAVVKQVETAIAEERARQIQQEILNSQKGFTELQKATEKSITDARSKTEELRRDLEKSLIQLKSIAEVGRSTAGGFGGFLINKLPGGKGSEAGISESIEIERSAEAKKQLLAAIATAQQLGLELQKNPLAENAIRFAEAVKRAEEVALRFIDLRTSLGPGGRPTLPGQQVPADDQLDQIRKTANVLIEQFATIDRGKSQLDEAKQALDRISNRSLGIPEQFGAIGTASTNAANTMIASFGQVGGVLEGLAIRATQLKNVLDSIQANIPATQNRELGGLIRYYANGGFVPRGKDTIPAMLSPGEMVMNPAATAKFYPMLVAMNAKQPVKYFNQGGPVTSVGDINITVAGGSNDKVVLKNIAHGLRRGIRRGTISL